MPPTESSMLSPLQALERQIAIAALGLAPEVIPGDAGDRYAATTGELISRLREAR